MFRNDPLTLKVPIKNLLPAGVYPAVLITVSDSHPVREEFFSYDGQVLPPDISLYRFFFILVSFLLLFQNSKFDHLLIQHSSDDRLGCSCVMNGIRQQCLRNLSLFDTLDVRIRGIKACIVQTIAADDSLTIRVIHRMRQILSEADENVGQTPASSAFHTLPAGFPCQMTGPVPDIPSFEVADHLLVHPNQICNICIASVLTNEKDHHFRS